MNITREQALAVLRKQQAGRDTLAGFARYIDIPGVPISGDVSDREYEVIDTPLALHHLIILNSLQLMAQGLLVYDPQVLDSRELFPVLRGETPLRGRADGGVPSDQGHAPSPDFTPTKTTSGQNAHPAAGAVETDVSDLHVEGADVSCKGQNTRSVMQGTSSSSSSRRESRSDTGTGGVSDPSSSETILTSFPPSPIYSDTVLTVLRDVLTGRIGELDARKLVFDDSPDLAVCMRVMLMLPPGSAKSTYASVVFPTWVMGRQRMFETILTGWGDPICKRHGKRARQICASPQYKALFDTGLDPNTRAAEDWMLMNDSSYKSAGILSGVSGFRAGGLVWDDLTKNRKEADSETIRSDVYNEYIDSARSRKTPHAWEVGIGTRWHEDEIMGRILPEGYNGESGFMKCRDGNVWLVLCMAAECERDDDPLGREVGEMIWPEWFGEEYWAEKRAVPRSWGSLYQQRPAPAEGIVFQADKFKRYSELPPGDDYIAYDPGVSGEGDPTAMHVWRVDADGKIYLRDRFYMKCSMDVWIIKLLEWVKRYKPIEAVSEAGVIRRAAEPWITRAMRKAKRFFTQSWVTRSANKVAMAQPALAMVNSGQVYLPNNSDGDALLDAALKFPASQDDHDVDAFANLCLRLEDIWDATPPQGKSDEDKPVLESGISIKSLMPPRHRKKVSRWAHRRNR